MRKILYLSSLLGLLLSPLFALAAEGDVYIVDVQKVIGGSIVGKAAKKGFELELQKREAELKPMKLELDRLKQDLEKQAAVLSAEALADKKEAFTKKEREFARAFQDNREELNKANSTQISKILEQVREVVKELAEKNKYQIIIERDPRVILYADSKLDITEKVIELLDQKKVG